MHRALSIVLLVATLAARPSAAAAQTRLEATPIIGMYVPLGALVDELDADGAVALRKRHIGTLLVGARSGVTFGRHVGLEASLIYSPSMVAVTDPVRTIDEGAGVLLLSLRTPLDLTADGADTEWKFHVAPGLGVVNRHGEVWSGYEGTTDLAFSLGGGVRLTSRRSRIHFRLELEDYITWARFARSGLLLPPSRLHHDLLWTLGIGIPMTGR